MFMFSIYFVFSYFKTACRRTTAWNAAYLLGPPRPFPPSRRPPPKRSHRPPATPASRRHLARFHTARNAKHATPHAKPLRWAAWPTLRLAPLARLRRSAATIEIIWYTFSPSQASATSGGPSIPSKSSRRRSSSSASAHFEQRSKPSKEKMPAQRLTRGGPRAASATAPRPT
jgi:hypothetical protein